MECFGPVWLSLENGLEMTGHTVVTLGRRTLQSLSVLQSKMKSALIAGLSWGDDLEMVGCSGVTLCRKGSSGLLGCRPLRANRVILGIRVLKWHIKNNHISAKQNHELYERYMYFSVVLTIFKHVLSTFNGLYSTKQAQYMHDNKIDNCTFTMIICLR